MIKALHSSMHSLMQRLHCEYYWANNGQSRWMLDEMFTLNGIISGINQRDGKCYKNFNGRFQENFHGRFNWNFDGKFKWESAGRAGWKTV